MNILSGQIYKVISSAMSLAFVIAVMFTAVPAQAGGYLHFGYGHHDEHHGYGHHYYSYGYPLSYGLHSYYGHHYYGHHYGGYGYPFYGYREPYEFDYGNSTSSGYDNHSYDRGSSRSRATGNGWALLGNHQADAALTDFGRQAQASPSKGAPKVGYALASADLGRLDKGVWAMRRALRIDPDSLHYVVLDQHMDAKVVQIIRQYEKKLAYSSADADAAFMLASLHYLRRNIGAAHSNIDQAMQVRHIRASTKNLRDLIDKEKEG